MGDVRVVLATTVLAAAASLLGQGANIVWTLLVATILFGGAIFAVPDL